MKEAYIEADKQNWTTLELEDYERASIKERDEIGRIELAERRAEARGEATGEAKGEIKGELKANLETAKQAKLMGLSIADISKLTGLSEEEIEKL